MKNKKVVLALILIFSIAFFTILFSIVVESQRQNYPINQMSLKTPTTKENGIAFVQGQVIVEDYEIGYNSVISAYLKINPETVVEQVTTDEDGKFVMYFATAGEYFISIEQLGCITNKYIDLTIEEGSRFLLTNIVLINGDINGDNEIDIMDLSRIADNFSILVDENNKIYDLNKDEKIDENDRNIIKSNYNKKTTEQIAEVIPAEGYGVKRETTSTISTCERVGQAEGLVANATKSGVVGENDFDSIYPWSDINTYNYDVTNKTITAWYGDENFAFDGTNGEVLTYIPEFYYKRIILEEDGVEYEYDYISEYPMEGYIKSPAFSVGRYMMSNVKTVGHSVSGKEITNYIVFNSFRAYAQALGEEFCVTDYRYCLLQMLYLVEYADYDAQSKLGKGVAGVGGTTYKLNTGSCDSMGMKSGSVGEGNSGKESVIYRGIEDFYGNLWEFVDGINMKNNIIWICKNPTQYQQDTYSAPYQQLGYLPGTADGSITKLGYDSNNPEMGFPVEVTNSYNVFDYYWQGAGTVSRMALVGGYCGQTGYAERAGPWYWALYYKNDTLNGYIGARLLKYK